MFVRELKNFLTHVPVHGTRTNPCRADCMAPTADTNYRITHLSIFSVSFCLFGLVHVYSLRSCVPCPEVKLVTLKVSRIMDCSSKSRSTRKLRLPRWHRTGAHFVFFGGLSGSYQEAPRTLKLKRNLLRARCSLTKLCRNVGSMPVEK